MKLISRDLSGNWTIAAGISPEQLRVAFDAIGAHGPLIPYASSIGAHDFAALIRMTDQSDQAQELANRLQNAFDKNSVWAF